MRPFKSKAVQILTLVLIVQAVVFYSVSKGESIPSAPPLSALSTRFGAWNMLQEGVIEKEVQDVLKADDVLTRSYGRSGTPEDANLLVAFFKSQRTGQAPHSPKNCLPG